MMNKRASGEELMFFAYFLIIIVIGGGIFFGVNAFYGSEYDFKLAESQELAYNIVSCFEQHDFFSDTAPDFYEVCKLNKGVLGEEHLILIQNSANSSQRLLVGVGDYVNQCYFEGTKVNPNYPACIKGTFSVRGSDYSYVIGSNQHIRRFSL